MGYEYKPPGKNSIDIKKISIGIVAVLLLLVLFSVGKIVTGYATYTGSLETELNSAKEDLRIISAAREECAAELNTKSNIYGECSSNLQSAQSALTQCQQDFSALKTGSETSLNECRTELNSAKSLQSSVTASYSKLVKNSVKAICCTISDVDSAALKQWRIENYKIICSGNFTVNCATGETSGF